MSEPGSSKPSAPRPDDDVDADPERVVIPLAAEELHVHRRAVPTGGLRIDVRTHEEPALLEALLGFEELEVERVPIDREVDGFQPVRVEGDVTIVPLHEERFTPRLFVREELRVRRRVREVPVQEQVAVRREEVSFGPVDDVGGRAASAAPGASVVTGGVGGASVWQQPRHDKEHTMKNVIAMYDERASAESAQQALIDQGIPRERISLASQDEFYGRDSGKAEAKKPGLLQRIFGFGAPKEDSHIYAEGVRRGRVLLRVQTGEDEVGIVEQALERFDPVDLDVQAEGWRAGGWGGYSEEALPYNQSEIERERLATRSSDVDHAAGGDGETRIPLAEEELRVGKRAYESGRVRVRTYTEEAPVSEEVELREEHVSVDRQAASGEVNPNEAFRDRTIEVSTFAEEPVVEKRAHVVEEVVIAKEVTTTPETVTDTVKRQVVEIDDEEQRTPSGR